MTADDVESGGPERRVAGRRRAGGEAGELARLNKELRREIAERERSSEALRRHRDLVVALGSVASLREAAEKVFEQALSIGGVDCCTLYVLDPESGGLHLVAHHGISPAYVAHVSHFEPEAIQTRVLLAGKPRYGSYSELAGQSDAATDREGVHTLAAIPILESGSIHAGIFFASRALDAFTQEAQTRMEALASHIGAPLARLRAQEALRLSEEKYRAVVEHAMEGIVVLQGGAVRFANRYARELAQLDRDPAEIGELMALVHPEDRARVMQNHRDRVEGRPAPAEYDFRFVRRDGTIRWMHLSAARIRWEDEPAVFILLSDITDRVRSEEEVRAARDQLETVTQQIGAGIAIISKEYRTVWANKVLKRIYGDVDGKICYETYNQREAICPGCGVKSVFETGVLSATHEQEGLDVDGKLIWSEIIATPVRDAEGRVTAALEVVVPVTARKLLEREVLGAADAEQTRISRDLHDSVGQELTGLSCMAMGLAQRLSERSAPEAAAAQSLAEGIRQALTPVRNAIRGLAPVPPEPDGLRVALEHLVAETQERCHLECRFEGAPRVRVRSAVTAGHLYRIAQEAINNAVKHSRARNLVVALDDDRGRLTLTVTDDGIGMSSRAKQAGGRGLRIMGYRAGVIEATLSIGPNPAGGTIVCCRAGAPARRGRKERAN